jgi:hypothetical protein
MSINYDRYILVKECIMNVLYIGLYGSKKMTISVGKYHVTFTADQWKNSATFSLFVHRFKNKWTMRVDIVLILDECTQISLSTTIGSSLIGGIHLLSVGFFNDQRKHFNRQYCSKPLNSSDGNRLFHDDTHTHSKYTDNRYISHVFGAELLSIMMKDAVRMSICIYVH